MQVPTGYLPDQYHLEYIDDGATLRRPDGKAIAFFPEDAPGADIVEIAWTDLAMVNGIEEQA